MSLDNNYRRQELDLLVASVGGPRQLEADLKAYHARQRAPKPAPAAKKTPQTSRQRRRRAPVTSKRTGPLNAEETRLMRKIAAILAGDRSERREGVPSA